MGSNREPSPLQAHRAVAHPLWVGSLMVLLVHEHLLKGTQLLPGAVSGRLGDLAALLVAPVILATLLRVRSRRGFRRVHQLIALLFAALALAPLAGQADPTRLLALPALLLSLRLFTPVAERAGSLLPLARRSALLAAAFGSVATSPPIEEAPTPQRFPDVKGSLGLGNDTGESQVIRVRKLKTSVQLDCTTVAASPSSFLDDELFQPAETWLVDDGRVLPLDDTAERDCHALLLDGDTMRRGLVFWQASGFPSRNLPSSTDTADTARTILLKQQGESAAMASHPAAFPAPGVAPGEVAEECQLPPAEEAVDWSTPLPAAEQTLLAVSPPTAGCVGLQLEKRNIYLCGLQGELPFVAGDKLRFELFDISGGKLFSVTRSGDGARVLLGRGNPSTLAIITELPLSPQPVSGCIGQRIECGGLARPAQLSTGEGSIQGGGVIETALGPIHLLQAKYLPVFDATCTPSKTTTGAYIEWSAIFAAP